MVAVLLLQLGEPAEHLVEVVVADLRLPGVVEPVVSLQLRAKLGDLLPGRHRARF
jgi:hypothetical protein